MSPTSAGFAVLLLVPVLVGAQTPAAETVFSGRVDVTVAEVEVFVSDRDGRPVPNLTREDFRVTEDGQPAEVTGVSPGSSQHLNLAVFLDQTTMDVTSRATALAGLRRFFESGLKPGDRVLLASWDGSLEIHAEPTGDPAILRAALDRLGAALPSGVRAAQERRAIQREIERLRAAVLGRGGRIADLAGVEEIQATLTALLKELRGQYVLGITPRRTGGKGSWHEVRVEVKGGLPARTQDGYFEP